MEELTTRGYEEADAPALAELLNVVIRHAGGHPGLTAELIRRYVATWVRDPAANSQLRHAPDGTLVAAGMATVPPEAGRRSDLVGAVHPDWRGSGLGRRLLAWQLDRARELHKKIAPDTDWEAHAATELADEDSQRLYRRFGMTPVRYWFSMVAPTAAVPPEGRLTAGSAPLRPLAAVPPEGLPLPEGLRAEPYAPRHESALYAAHTAAFADHWGFHPRPLPDWAAFTVRSERFLPELSLLAFDREELAGYLLSYQDAEPDRLYIGQVGVRPAWRRRGLAGALLARVLRAAAGAGLARAGLGVDADSPTGAVGVYERAGFAVESRAVTYATPLR